jgi:ribosomal protein S18 acetylase RimI-like enzyme
MDAAWDWAMENGSQIRAEVKRTNARALRFFVKCGFRPTEANASAGDSIMLIKAVLKVSVS